MSSTDQNPENIKPTVSLSHWIHKMDSAPLQEDLDSEAEPVFSNQTLSKEPLSKQDPASTREPTENQPQAEQTKMDERSDDSSPDKQSEERYVLEDDTDTKKEKKDSDKEDSVKENNKLKTSVDVKQDDKSGSQKDESFIILENISVSFGKQHVLRDLNITIPRGQTLALLGESGCGKTVTLKALIGLVEATKGRVIFDGQDIAKLSDKALTQQRTRFGFVFQMAALFDSMTVGQNIAFPIFEHTDNSHEAVEERVLQLLQEVGLSEDVILKKPAELSGGMRKRVGLARALAIEPEVMLYDEPTTGLDPIMSDVINELIVHTRDNHDVTSIVVTHDMKTALKVADRIIMLYPLSRLEPDAPQILYDGRADEISNYFDSRVTQFVAGEAGERINEMRAS